MKNSKKEDYNNLKITENEKSKLENSFVVLLMVFIFNIAYIFYFLPRINNLQQVYFEFLIWVMAFTFTYKALYIVGSKQRIYLPKLSSAIIALIMAGLIRGWFGIFFYIIFLPTLWKVIKRPYYFREKAIKNIEKRKTIEERAENKIGFINEAIKLELQQTKKEFKETFQKIKKYPYFFALVMLGIIIFSLIFGFFVAMIDKNSNEGINIDDLENNYQEGQEHDYEIDYDINSY